MQMLRAIAKAIDTVSRGLNRVALGGAILAVLVMVCAVGYQVVARYIFFSPPPWTEEIARYAMIWAGLLGASAAFRAHADPTLFPQMQRLGGGTGMVLALGRAVGVLLFAAPVLYFSVFGTGMNPMRGFIMRSYDKSTGVTDVSLLFVAGAVPLVFCLIVVHLLADLAMRAASLPTNRWSSNESKEI
jgi:TRAP-type C4-dicarboxylate transport system permease small subunit